MHGIERTHLISRHILTVALLAGIATLGLAQDTAGPDTSGDTPLSGEAQSQPQTQPQTQPNPGPPPTEQFLTLEAYRLDIVNAPAAQLPAIQARLQAYLRSEGYAATTPYLVEWMSDGRPTVRQIALQILAGYYAWLDRADLWELARGIGMPDHQGKRFMQIRPGSGAPTDRDGLIAPPFRFGWIHESEIVGESQRILFVTPDGRRYRYGVPSLFSPLAPSLAEADLPRLVRALLATVDGGHEAGITPWFAAAPLQVAAGVPPIETVCRGLILLAISLASAEQELLAGDAIDVAQRLWARLHPDRVTLPEDRPAPDADTSDRAFPIDRPDPAFRRYVVGVLDRARYRAAVEQYALVGSATATDAELQRIVDRPGPPTEIQSAAAMLQQSLPTGDRDLPPWADNVAWLPTLRLPDRLGLFIRSNEAFRASFAEGYDALPIWLNYLDNTRPTRILVPMYEGLPRLVRVGEIAYHLTAALTGNVFAPGTEPDSRSDRGTPYMLPHVLGLLPHLSRAIPEWWAGDPLAAKSEVERLADRLLDPAAPGVALLFDRLASRNAQAARTLLSQMASVDAERANLAFARVRTALRDGRDIDGEPIPDAATEESLWQTLETIAEVAPNGAMLRPEVLLLQLGADRTPGSLDGLMADIREGRLLAIPPASQRLLITRLRRAHEADPAGVPSVDEAMAEAILSRDVLPVQRLRWLEVAADVTIGASGGAEQDGVLRGALWELLADRRPIAGAHVDPRLTANVWGAWVQPRWRDVAARAILQAAEVELPADTGQVTLEDREAIWAAMFAEDAAPAGYGTLAAIDAASTGHHTARIGLPYGPLPVIDRISDRRAERRLEAIEQAPTARFVQVARDRAIDEGIGLLPYAAATWLAMQGPDGPGEGSAVRARLQPVVGALAIIQRNQWLHTYGASLSDEERSAVWDAIAAEIGSRGASSSADLRTWVRLPAAVRDALPATRRLAGFDLVWHRLPLTPERAERGEGGVLVEICLTLEEVPAGSDAEESPDNANEVPRRIRIILSRGATVIESRQMQTLGVPRPTVLDVVMPESIARWESIRMQQLREPLTLRVSLADLPRR